MAKSSQIAKLLITALQNEIILDIDIRNRIYHDNKFSNLPNYKLMKQVSLKSKLKFLYWPFIWASFFIIPFRTVLLAICSFLIRVVYKKKITQNGLHVIATTVNNKKIICEALNLSNITYCDIDYNIFNYKTLSKSLSIKELYTSFKACLCLYWLIIWHNKKQMFDLVLHSYDATILIMLINYIQNNPDQSFITDDHYQRWAYILSNTSTKVYIVQHGFIDGNLNFKNKFGNVTLLFVKHKSFIPIFEKYFKIEKSETYLSTTNLIETPFSKNAVLLASSYPTIDMEIAFLKELRKTCTCPVIIKLHPNHAYDDRKDVLLSYATYISKSTENLYCKVFISYNSFLEYDYKSQNIITYSLKENGLEQVLIDVRTDIMCD